MCTSKVDPTGGGLGDDSSPTPLELAEMVPAILYIANGSERRRKYQI